MSSVLDETIIIINHMVNILLMVVVRRRFMTFLLQI